jgi:hypothetical protein
MTAPASGIARVEKKVDDFSQAITNKVDDFSLAMTSAHTAILERLASIEATSKAEAAERATVNSYTRTAIEALQRGLDDERAARIAGDIAEAAAREKAQDDTVAGRRWALGLAIGSFIFPLILGLIWLLISAGGTR